MSNNLSDALELTELEVEGASVDVDVVVDTGVVVDIDVVGIDVIVDVDVVVDVAIGVGVLELKGSGSML